MIEIIKCSYNELNNLKENGSYSISKVNWWLLKYGDLYKKCVSINNKLCDTCVQLEKEDLPYNCLSKPDYCNKDVEYSSFIKFYNELDELTQIHKLEYKCFLANDVYLLYDFRHLNLNEWIEDYKHLYEKLSVFFYEYLDSDSLEKISYISSPNKTFEILINKSEFREVIYFYNYYEEYLKENP